MIRILIADDHAIVRKGVRQLIFEEYSDAFFGEAGDADELMEKLERGKWDLVICDLNMPGCSGIDVLGQIKRTKPEIPVLIMSLHSEEQYALRVLKEKASGYLSKDTIHLNLIKAIHNALGGKRFISQTVAEKLAGAYSYGNNEFHDTLSKREYDVFLLLVSGISSADIAKKLAISATTVSTYRARIMEKMGMKSNAELIRYAIEKNLI